MEAKYKIIDNTLIIKLSSELDHHNASMIKEQTDQCFYHNQIKNIIFDFSKTAFMDSSGIGVIMGRYKMVKRLGGNVSIVNINKSIERIFEISGLYKLVQKHESLEKALKGWKGGHYVYESYEFRIW